MRGAIAALVKTWGASACGRRRQAPAAGARGAALTRCGKMRGWHAAQPRPPRTSAGETRGAKRRSMNGRGWLASAARPLARTCLPCISERRPAHCLQYAPAGTCLDCGIPLDPPRCPLDTQPRQAHPLPRPCPAPRCRPRPAAVSAQACSSPASTFAGLCTDIAHTLSGWAGYSRSRTTHTCTRFAGLFPRTFAGLLTNIAYTLPSLTVMEER